MPPAEIRGLTLSTTFSGGIGGDNWNLDSLRVTAVGPGVSQLIATRGLNRFTGDRKVLTVDATP